MRSSTTHGLAGMRLGVFGKGGSGKSTLTVILAKCLQLLGYNVCILDADSTNVGMNSVLGIPRAPLPLIDWFGGTVFSGGTVTCPVDDPTPLVNSKVSVEDLPVEYEARTDDGILLLEAGKVTGRGPGAGCDGPIAKIARDLWIESNGPHPVMVIDFKAGLEDSARGVLTNLDWGLVVVEPTAPAIELAAKLKQISDEIRAGHKPATAHIRSRVLARLVESLYEQSRLLGIETILNRVDNDATASYLTDRLARYGLFPVASIPMDTSIALSWLRMEPIDVLPFIHFLEPAIDRLEIATDRRGPWHGRPLLKEV